MFSRKDQNYHIVFDERGNALIANTTMKVRELVAEHLFYGWQPTELAHQHDYLSLGQIYAALSYYYDHQSEIDQQIKADLAFGSELSKRLGQSLLSRKLQQGDPS